MAAAPRTAAPHSPFDARPPPSAPSLPVILIITLLHAVLIFWIYKTKIEPKISVIDDTAVEVTLARTPPPPPPPPVEPATPPTGSPPPIQPRLALVAPDAPPPATAPLVAVEHPEPPHHDQPVVVTPPAPPAPAAPAQPVHVITRPSWEHLPSGDDINRYYPEIAQRLGRSGKALIRCHVHANGAVFGCEVIAEDPQDFGFGDAALKLVPYFKLRPKTLDGEPVDGSVIRIPIIFSAG